MNSSRVKVCAASISWALLLVLGLASPMLADENPSENQAVTQSEPQTVFELYCGNCSRSMQYHSSYPSFALAVDAAAKANGERLRTDIKSSDLPDGARTKYSPAIQLKYQVYVRTCKAWSLHSSLVSYTDALDVTKKLNDIKPASSKLIWHYTRREDVVSR